MYKSPRNVRTLSSCLPPTSKIPLTSVSPPLTPLATTTPTLVPAHLAPTTTRAATKNIRRRHTVPITMRAFPVPRTNSTPLVTTSRPHSTTRSPRRQRKSRRHSIHAQPVVRPVSSADASLPTTSVMNVCTRSRLPTTCRVRCPCVPHLDVG